MRRPVVVALVLASLACAATAADLRGFTVQDLVTMDRISGFQVSSDGERVVFVRRHTDLEADKGRTDLWLIGADGEGLRRLTSRDARVGS